MKTYLHSITVVDLAHAIQQGSAGVAVDLLNETAWKRENPSGPVPKLEYQPDIDVVVWQATSLAIRLGLLLEWLDAEASS